MQQILEKLARRHDHVQEPAKQLATRLAQLDHA
jgi:prefoldin subunit 5